MGHLRAIPGVGKETELDLQALGVARVDQLEGADPDELFARLTAHQGGYTDRCNLYVYRCAIYFAEGGRDPALLRWWNWKDAAHPPIDLLRINANGSSPST